MAFKRRGSSITIVFSSAVMLVSIVSSFTLISNGPVSNILALVWFLLNAIASGLCAIIFGSKKPSNKLMELQDHSNWAAGAIGMPCLTAHFLFKQGASTMFALFHISIAVSMGALYVQERLNCVKRKTNIDLDKISTVVAALTTLTATACCYSRNDIYGVLGGVLLILSNVVLATDKSVGDFTPLDAFLVGLAASNYLFSTAV